MMRRSVVNMPSAELDAIIDEYSIDELLQIASELGLKKPTTKKGLSVRLVGGTILGDLQDNGVPDPDDRAACSDLMYDFLVNTGFVEEEEDEQSEEIVEEPIKKPECFSLADDRDPSCRKCKVLEMCKVKRIQSRPKCFGVLWDPNEVECKVCIEFNFCKQALEAKNGRS